MSISLLGFSKPLFPIRSITYKPLKNARAMSLFAEDGRLHRRIYRWEIKRQKRTDNRFVLGPSARSSSPKNIGASESADQIVPTEHWYQFQARRSDESAADFESPLPVF
jgi:hypothetical protein